MSFGMMSCEDKTNSMDFEDAEAAARLEALDIDDVFMSDPRDRSNDIADLFKWAYAEHLRPVMATLAKKYCNRCYYDHPSQLEHDVCILMPFAEQIDRWFEEALTMINEDCVIGTWFGALGRLHPTTRYHEVSKYLDPTFRL